MLFLIDLLNLGIKITLLQCILQFLFFSEFYYISLFFATSRVPVGSNLAREIAIASCIVLKLWFYEKFIKFHLLHFWL